MPKFDYVRPNSLGEAISLLNDPGHRNKLLAGGTDVLVYLHHAEPDFDRVVDIHQLAELKSMQREGNVVTIGAGVTFSEAMESEVLQEAVPFLVDACRQVGGPQIRNMGTLGGNVANAAACADSLPVLVCLDARATLQGADGERSLSVAELVTGPNRTSLQPGEILTKLSFEVPPAGVKTAFIKLGRRNAQAISRLTVAAAGRIDEKGLVDYLHITPGAATPQIMRFSRSEELLLGKASTAENIHATAAMVAEEMIGTTGRRWSTEYKEPAITALAERALQQVFRQKS